MANFPKTLPPTPPDLGKLLSGLPDGILPPKIAQAAKVLASVPNSVFTNPAPPTLPTLPLAVPTPTVPDAEDDSPMDDPSVQSAAPPPSPPSTQGVNKAPTPWSMAKSAAAAVASQPYTQRNRSMKVTTPLGPDLLLLTGFHGREGLSRMFTFHLDMIATNETPVPFQKLIGQSATVEFLLPGASSRYFNGVISRFSQGRRDNIFTHYRCEIVPQLWLLTHKVQCRIFQHMAVPDILKKVLTGLNFEMRLQGTFFAREYCVQYRESDFAFASRLMEEEGIFYYFEHSDGNHKLVLGNNPQAHSDVVEFPEVLFEDDRGGLKEELRILTWEKTQELRSGKYTLWDYNFELPYQHLEADRPSQDKAQVGTDTLELLNKVNTPLEIYDYPGHYAYHFDGVDRGGGDQPADLTHIFDENKRYVQIRMEEEAVQGVQVEGLSTARNFASGQKFKLKRHFTGDGEYILTQVEHAANLSANFRSGGSSHLQYQNRYAAIPVSVPYRPTRTTPRPLIHGTQAAVVVGPPGEEIFCDKYGRVKVQFLWDRDGKWDADSSCWVRVATQTSDNSSRMVHVPRMKSEVIVAFEEGDPDKPIIVGTVFNAQHMPTWKLPDYRDWHGFSIASYPGNTATDGASSFQRIDASTGNEKWHENAPHDRYIHVGHNNTYTIDNNDTTQIGNNFILNIANDRHEIVGYPAKSGPRGPDVALDGSLTDTGDGSMSLQVKKDYTFQLDTGNLKSTVVAGQATYTVHKDITMTSETGQVDIEACTKIVLHVGGSTIEMLADGTINVTGNTVINLNC